MLRHMVATVAYRGGIAVAGAPEGFALFHVSEEVRTPGEILAHIGDLLEGSIHLLKGELVYLTSSPLEWDEEVSRFFSTAKRLDLYLASDAPLACRWRNSSRVQSEMHSPTSGNWLCFGESREARFVRKAISPPR